MNKISIVILSSLILFSGCLKSGKKEGNNWVIADFLSQKSDSITISGSPQLVDSPFGKAVAFNGIDDGVFLNKMPLKKATSFTIEMIFKPSKNDAPFEQRILHIGEVFDDRMLLEIRAKDNAWYFDGFVASENRKITLANEKIIHSLGQWYHVALVVKENNIITYVNGKQELKESFLFTPINTGKTSLGVRLNKRSWFKGSIYKVKITKKALQPDSFISIEKLIK